LGLDVRRFLWHGNASDGEARDSVNICIVAGQLEEGQKMKGNASRAVLGVVQWFFFFRGGLEESVDDRSFVKAVVMPSAKVAAASPMPGLCHHIGEVKPLRLDGEWAAPVLERKLLHEEELGGKICRSSLRDSGCELDTEKPSCPITRWAF
jgi:hypothetical protein